jgi:hypothetical protein
MSLQKVEGHTNLRKDTSSGGVVNVDTKSFSAYKTQRLFALQKHEEVKQPVGAVSQLETEINNIKSDMQDIKLMLQTLLEKGK